uniref:Acyl-CoA thioesterase n=1 Tax=Steinernema glaseri TaxID=37863 RepID=A0A1I7YDE0_9BILA
MHGQKSSLSSIFSPIRACENRVRFDPPHLGGSKADRLFGGQTTAQVAQAVKLLNPECCVHTIKVNFVAPGNITTSLTIDLDRVPETQFVHGHVFQDKREIATCKVRYGGVDDLLDAPVYQMENVRSPLSYATLEELLRTTEERHPWRLLTLLVKNGFFEMRPVDGDHILSVPMDRKALQVWCRISEACRGDEAFAKADGVSIVLMISDYLVAIPAHINLLQYHQEHEFGIGASLNHMVTFHEVSNLDPAGWYLYQANCAVHSYNRYIIDAQIFDTRGRCVLSSVQEGYLSRN